MNDVCSPDNSHDSWDDEGKRLPVGAPEALCFYKEMVAGARNAPKTPLPDPNLSVRTHPLGGRIKPTKPLTTNFVLRNLDDLQPESPRADAGRLPITCGEAGDPNPQPVQTRYPYRPELRSPGGTSALAGM